MKKPIIALIVLVFILLGIGAYLLKKNSVDTPPVTTTPKPTTTTPPQDTPVVVDEEPEEPQDKTKTVIGTSVEKRDITAYHYGEGDTELLFVGGIHGGYSWNTALVAFEMMDYLAENPEVIPDNVKVTVIPVLNPDGLNKIVGTDGRFSSSDVPSSQVATIPGRFNANNVDLNRNFDCEWQSTGIWQSRSVSGGSAAFSEPESQALRDYVEAHNIAGAVVWYSAAGGVFASNCRNGVSAETSALTETYAKASGYRAYQTFSFYDITGDMVNWLAKNDIPAISVLLTTHQDIEWTKNKAGIDAVLSAYAE